MSEISAVSMSLYRIEQAKENCKKAGVLYALTDDQLAVLEAVEEHNKAVEIAEKLQAEIDRLKNENEKLREAYKNKPISTRKATEETVRNLFSWLEDKVNISFTKDSKEDVIVELADNPDFFDDMLHCLENHIDSFGENYGIVVNE